MLPRRRERALLAALLLRPGEVVSTDRLADAIWGETPPRTAVGSLQNAVSELRKALGHDVVITRSPGYALGVDPEAIDAVRFERAVMRAAKMEPAERAESLSAALALWRGPPLEEFAYEGFAAAEIARLEELRLTAIEARIEADLEHGRHTAVVPELEALAQRHPLRERLQGQRMLALYRSGRQSDALEAYRRARDALDEQLGIEPGPALRDLERRILNHDPALGARGISLAAAHRDRGAAGRRPALLPRRGDPRRPDRIARVGRGSRFRVLLLAPRADRPGQAVLAARRRPG